MSRKEMVLMSKEELKQLLESKYEEGIVHGVQLMKERMLLACQNGTPVEIDGAAFFVQDAISNLRHIFDSLEREE